MKSFNQAAFAAFFAAAVFTPAISSANLITLEDPSLGVAQYDENWSPAAGFVSGGTLFNNVYNESFSSWGGFALSKVSDIVTPGFENQYAAYAPLGIDGRGAGGSAQFAVAYYEGFTPVVPTITLAAGERPVSISITNTTYAALSMRDGDGFAKKFGGVSGNEPDFFKLTISGFDAFDAPTGAVDFFLADFRFANNALDYIVSDWTQVDLTALPESTRSLRLSFESTDNGGFGMNTPAFASVDNLQTVPEPTAAGLIALASLGLAVRRKRA